MSEGVCTETLWMKLSVVMFFLFTNSPLWLVCVPSTMLTVQAVLSRNLVFFKLLFFLLLINYLGITALNVSKKDEIYLSELVNFNFKMFVCSYILVWLESQSPQYFIFCLTKIKYELCDWEGASMNLLHITCFTLTFHLCVWQLLIILSFWSMIIIL